MSVLSLSELPAAERSNVIDFCARRQPAERSESLLASDLRVRAEVYAECESRRLTSAQTDDALATAMGTLAFGMAPDRAIAAGKCRAAKLALGQIKPAPRTWPTNDDLPPAA